MSHKYSCAICDLLLLVSAVLHYVFRVYYTLYNVNIQSWLIGFCCQIIPHCMGVPHSVHPLANACVSAFCLLWILSAQAFAYRSIVGLLSSLSLSIWAELLYHKYLCLTVWRTVRQLPKHHFAFLLEMEKSFHVSVSLPTFVIMCVSDMRGNEVVAHCTFHLYLPDYEWHWTPFHVTMLN